MTFNIDIIIVVTFLVANLAVGIYSGRGIKNIKEYALGDRNFSTATIAATVIATWISGSDFVIPVSETYRSGIWYIVAGSGYALNLIVVAYIFNLKVSEFEGSISVAEAMGKIYGQSVRLITAFASIASSIAIIAIQLKVFSTIFSHFFDFTTAHATIISSGIIILYSAFGGIKAVTFTDMIQFITFGVVIPMIALLVWQMLGSQELIKDTLVNPLFSPKEITQFHPEKSLQYLSIFLCGVIPALNPTMFQRMLMTKNSKQIKQAFFVSSVVCLGIYFASCTIGFIMFSHNAHLIPENLVMNVIDQYSPIGLKGFALVGIMAMIMSTADSWINTTAIIFTHDICTPLGLKLTNELLLSRIVALFIGILSIFFTINSNHLLDLLFLSENFYMPIVTVPLMLVILGFRTSTKTVLIAMTSGLLSMMLWKQYIQPLTNIDSVVPAMLANLITFMGSHYLLKQPGGWIKNQKISKPLPPSYLSKAVQSINNFRKIGIIAHCNKQLPKKEFIYSYFALAIALTIIISLTIDKNIYQAHSIVIHTMQAITLFISTIFLANKLWSNNFREKYIGLIWYFSIFIGLAFNSIFLLLLCNFSQESLVILVLNLSIIAILLPWLPTMIMIITGAITAFYSYDFLIGMHPSIETYNATHIAYSIFITITFLIMFEKPREEELELAEEKIDHLSDRVDFQNQEIDKLTELKYEFLRNIEHEAYTPITGITNLAEMLWLDYDKISEKDKIEMTQMVASSADRLKSFISNFIDLSKLTSLTYKSLIKPINLSQLLKDRLDLCTRLYITSKNANKQIFNLEIDEKIIIEGDEYLITRVIDNLIINSIKYCPEGNIDIKLQKNDSNIEFSITDEGIGIPTEELRKVFGIMVVSSRTKTPSGGRGVGLSLCKKALELHKGDIWAEENKYGKGVTFKFTIPA